MPAIAVIFLFSLLLPFNFNIGPLLLKPYRIVLLVLFLPFLFRLLTGGAGKMTKFDALLLGATLWSALALIANHPFATVIEPIGLQFIEFFGAYLLARVCIRSADDCQRVVRMLFSIILFLLPFAAIESVTQRPVLLMLVGEMGQAVDIGVRFGLRRAQTVFAHPIHYGAFVSAGLGLTWYALRQHASFGRRLACAAVIALSTFFSLSTGALIALVMQCVFIAWEAMTAPARKRWRVFAWGAFAGYVFIDVLSNRSPFHVLVDYASFNTGSAYNRILIWRYGTDNVAAHPVFGLGLHDWERPGWMGGSVDNFWLLLTMQYGLPFIVMFAGAMLLILRRISHQHLSDPVERICRAGYLTTLGGLVLAGGTVHYWQTMMAFVLFIFGSGIWIITGGAKSSEPAVAESGRPARGQAPIGRARIGRAGSRSA